MSHYSEGSLALNHEKALWKDFKVFLSQPSGKGNIQSIKNLSEIILSSPEKQNRLKMD